MSGRKNNLLNFKDIVNGDMTTTITSAVTNIQRLDNIGIQFNFTGAPVGTFYVEVSADYAQDFNGTVTNPGNWIPLVLNPVPVAAGTAGSVYIDITQTSGPWMRTQYVPTSGSGTLTGYITGKMI